MSARFHINSKGDPAPCRASIRDCPLGGESPHFDNAEQAARWVFEQELAASEEEFYNQRLSDEAMDEWDDQYRQQELDQAGLDAFDAYRLEPAEIEAPADLHDSFAVSAHEEKRLLAMTEEEREWEFGLDEEAG
ncbi:hypothetical protein [Nocardioides sp. Root140]|uniref:hypothetical protein n=1 Tax=Nocardioides sp. Root140 TaxID=1736460 RepID=UPI000AC4F28B|nr:hypothetical protein [Nocardioides sp. Root140]